MTPAQAKLLRALIHGMSSPAEILAKPALSLRLREILRPLVGQYDDISGHFFQPTFRWWNTRNDGGLLISNRVDLTELELAYFFKLAELGVRIRFELPIDDSGNGFSLPVTHLAARIDKRHDLKNIEISFKPFKQPQNFVRYEAPDLVQEARLVAQVVRGYDPAKKIAVAMRVLDRRALIFEDALKAQGISKKILCLPELMGQKFDLVIIADCAHGRLTLAREPDWPLKDSDCFEINRLMGREVLRRFEEDPLEPSLFSPRQALEPMWFLGAASAASDRLLMTSSLVDDRYQAQVSSELTKIDWLGNPQSIDVFNRPLAPIEQLLSRHCEEAAADVAIYDEEIASSQGKAPRNDAYLHLDPKLFRERFASKLGLLESKPLSATRLEAFARCPFKAFIEKLLEVDLNPAPGADVEPRVLGQMAHAVLEKYYGEREKIGAILAKESEHFLLKNPDVHRGVWKAMTTWLQESLERLVSNLEKNPPILSAKPVAFEQKLGPMSIQIGQDTIFIGGVVDRIDQSSDSNIVIDYKLSSLSSLKMRMGPKEILKTHFQIPVYLKLLSSFPPLKKGGQGGFLGYPISIKDGGPGPLINMTGRFEELDQAISSLLEPILQGVLELSEESCRDIRLKRLCRC